MTDDRRRDRIRWHCRRGLLELDLILAGVLERYFDRFNEEELGLFEQLLAMEDTTLFDCLQGVYDPESPEMKRFVDKVRQ